MFSPIKALMQFFSMIVPKQFHPNQKTAAEEILGHFNDGVRYVQLSAQMQSGKTGCALYVAFDMLERGTVDKVFVISGSAETELREQWREKFPIHLANFCQMRNITDKKRVKELGQIFDNGIVWRTALLKNADLFDSRYLVVWDESHFATTEKQTLHKFYDQVGLMSCIQGDTTDLVAKDSYMLSVTATRCAEQSKFAGATDGVAATDWAMVVMRPGDSYRGVQEIKARGLLHPSVTVSEENMVRVRTVFEKYRDQKKFIVMRCDQNKDTLVSALAAEMGILVVRYNMKTKSTTNVDTLEDEPEGLTLFLIRGMLRMGKELPKEHIAAVYECAAMSRTNTTLQGLLGRTCGYYVDDIEDVAIDVYIPGGSDNDAVNEYIESVESGFTKGITGTQHIPKHTRATHREWHTNVPSKLAVGSDTYTCFGDSCAKLKKHLNVVCRDVADIIGGEDGQPSVFDRNNYTSEQLTEMETFFQTGASKSLEELADQIVVEETHFSHGGIKKGSAKHMPKIVQAYRVNAPVMAWKTDHELRQPLRIVKVSGSSGLEGTGVHKGDVFLIFNTRAMNKFDDIRAMEVAATNGKDIHHTKADVGGEGMGRDEDGVSKTRLSDEVKTNIGALKKAIKQLIKRSLEKNTGVRCDRWVKTKNIQFDKDVYKNFEYIKAIIQSVAKESFNDQVDIKVTRHINTADSGQVVRVGMISWK